MLMLCALHHHPRLEAGSHHVTLLWLCSPDWFSDIYLPASAS